MQELNGHINKGTADQRTLFQCSQDSDANLASTTLRKDNTDQLGIVVTYSVQVDLECGALVGNLTTNLPFKLMHPVPGESSSHESRRTFLVSQLSLSYIPFSSHC